MECMQNHTISARVELDEYSNKVLSMIKAKYGLKDKSDAINKFVEIYGEEIVEKEASEEYVKDMINGVKEHFKKCGNKTMSLKELDVLCEV